MANRLLWADDEIELLNAHIIFLRNKGYEVNTVTNGLDAIEIYSANPGAVDLVLMDMIMPKVGGSQAFTRIREIDPEAKILLSSGFVNEEDIQHLLKQGACGFLSKPHRLPVVVNAIRDALDGKDIRA